MDFLGPNASPYVFYINQIHIIFSKIQLKNIRMMKLHSNPLSPFKKKRFMSYKYTMNNLEQSFRISSFSTTYIFSEHLFL